MKKIVAALLVLVVLIAGFFLVTFVVDHVSEDSLLTVGVSIAGTAIGLVVGLLILALLRGVRGKQE